MFQRQTGFNGVLNLVQGEAEFSPMARRLAGPEGPTKCSGLEVVRYDAETLHGEFGDSPGVSVLLLPDQIKDLVYGFYRQIA